MAKEAKRVWKSAAALETDIGKMLELAREEDAKDFDTLRTKLGRLLLALSDGRPGKKKFSIDELMKEWDRNGDGEISKHEFRVNVRKLGLSETMATTAQIDALYDSFDQDRSNSLEVGELKEAFQELKEDVEATSGQQARLAAHVEGLTSAVEAYRKAVAMTARFEAGESELDQMRGGTVASRLGLHLKLKKVNVADIVGSWDKDGSSTIDKKEFKQHVRNLGFKASEHDLEQLFVKLRSDASVHTSSHLDTKMLRDALRRLQAATGTVRIDLAAATKTVAKTRRLAEAAQLAAETLREDIEAKRVAAEAEAEHEKAVRKRAADKAAAEKAAAKRKASHLLKARTAGVLLQQAAWSAGAPPIKQSAVEDEQAAEQADVT